MPHLKFSGLPTIAGCKSLDQGRRDISLLGRLVSPWSLPATLREVGLDPSLTVASMLNLREVL